MLDKKYTPINCSYHDQLLELATLKKRVQIVFISPEGKNDSVEGVIVDVYTHSNKEEYLVLDSGREIRLDHIISAGIYSVNSFPNNSNRKV